MITGAQHPRADRKLRTFTLVARICETGRDFDFLKVLGR